MGEVKERELENIPVTKEEGDEETTNATITIEEGMDGFKLCVCVCAVDERGEITWGVEEVF